MKLFKEVLKIKNPRYIDIGAHHPYEISNTALFYEHGCRGINIEANPVLFELFKKERPDDLNICCGVCAEDSEVKTMPFYMLSENHGRNTFVKQFLDDFIKENPEFEIKEVRKIPVKSLSKLFAENHIDQLPDYMSIDIEGMEYDVLKDFDLRNKGSKVITIEINSYSAKRALIKKMLEDAGYFLWLKIHSNYTYIKNDYYELIYK